MPLTLLLNATGVIVAPEHIVCVAGVATAFGVGFTSTVAVLVQLFDVAVMMNVT